MRAFSLLALLLLVCIPLSAATLYFHFDNVPKEQKVTQLWYDGFWQDVDWFNGSVAYFKVNQYATSGTPLTPLDGKICVVVNHVPPHEPIIYSAQQLGAVAVLFVRISATVMDPGSTMYFIDGSDRKRLTIPVFETIAYSETDPICVLPAGTYIMMQPTPNEFMRVNSTPFQLVMCLTQSLLEIGIFAFGSFRLKQFYDGEGSFRALLAIGPIVISLELGGVLLRLIYTSYDPFWTYRLAPDKFSEVFVSISFPFTLSAGILLTFFWAETLSSHSMQVVSFLQEYRKPAFIAVGSLFCVEFICSALRDTVQGLVPISPNYVSIFIYLLVSLALSIGYTIAAVKVAKRISVLPYSDINRHVIQRISIRALLSVIGYAGFVLCMICYFFFASAIWGLPLILNCVFICENWVALTQVVAVHRTSSVSQSKKDISNSNSGRTLGTGSTREEKSYSSVMDMPMPDDVRQRLDIPQKRDPSIRPSTKGSSNMTTTGDDDEETDSMELKPREHKVVAIQGYSVSPRSPPQITTYSLPSIQRYATSESSTDDSDSPD